MKLRAELDRNIPGARCIVKQLEQGPELDEPIQARISGDNLDILTQLSPVAWLSHKFADVLNLFEI